MYTDEHLYFMYIHVIEVGVDHKLTPYSPNVNWINGCRPMGVESALLRSSDVAVDPVNK